MKKVNLIYLYIQITVIFFSCSKNYKGNTDKNDVNYYSQENYNRTAAEWEPALGALVVWPLSIPYKLVIELAKDEHLFTVVESEDARKEAEHWFSQWQIDLNRVTFIYAQQGEDSWWTRDWGPSAIFTPNHTFKLGDGKYIYSTPITNLTCNDSLQFIYFDKNNKIELTQVDDDATIAVGKQLGFELLDLPFNNTGGNVLNDGLGTAFSTCVIYAENKFHGLDENEFLRLNDSLLGFKRYNIISNFEKRGIQHIDCLLKLIDEETILVAEPPSDHELHKVYNDIVHQELSKLKTAYNRPYKILRIKTARYNRNQLAAYTNSLILNNTVYVPLFNIDQDSVAIKTWANVMPGYKIKGFKFLIDEEPLVSDKLKSHYVNYGWNSGDALHCRTRAIWNPEMLFISIKKIEPEVKSNQDLILFASIIDYSKKGLIKSEAKLFWRLVGEDRWNTEPLNQTENENHFFAQIPNQKSGAIVEYYITAASISGNRESRPSTAPLGAYKFTIK
ncbi:agmatine deiminase family protein [Geojedonia litorea]|uniref:Agmatine deiminase family protein n=1 Tax=Geojedonia litorea TaxID=1268269 RepID=A0ABV9N358_9FLAO